MSTQESKKIICSLKITGGNDCFVLSPRSFRHLTFFRHLIAKKVGKKWLIFFADFFFYWSNFFATYFYWLINLSLPNYFLPMKIYLKSNWMKKEQVQARETQEIKNNEVTEIRKWRQKLLLKLTNKPNLHKPFFPVLYFI